MKTTPEQRAVLSFIAAQGLLHPHSLYGARVGLHSIHDQFPAGDREEIGRILKSLVDTKLVSHYDTGHYGYGDHWVEGTATYTVTVDGLMALWGAST